MNKLFLLLIFSFTIVNCFAQNLSNSDKKILEKKEDSLKILALAIIQGRTSEERFTADSQFTKMFVRALKVKGFFSLSV